MTSSEKLIKEKQLEYERLEKLTERKIDKLKFKYEAAKRALIEMDPFDDNRIKYEELLDELVDEIEIAAKERIRLKWKIADFLYLEKIHTPEFF